MRTVWVGVGAIFGCEFSLGLKNMVNDTRVLTDLQPEEIRTILRCKNGLQSENVRTMLRCGFGWKSEIVRIIVRCAIVLKPRD